MPGKNLTPFSLIVALGLSIPCLSTPFLSQADEIPAPRVQSMHSKLEQLKQEIRSHHQAIEQQRQARFQERVASEKRIDTAFPRRGRPVCEELIRRDRAAAKAAGPIINSIRGRNFERADRYIQRWMREGEESERQSLRLEGRYFELLNAIHKAELRADTPEDYTKQVGELESLLRRLESGREFYDELFVFFRALVLALQANDDAILQLINHYEERLASPYGHESENAEYLVSRLGELFVFLQANPGKGARDALAVVTTGAEIPLTKLPATTADFLRSWTSIQSGIDGLGADYFDRLIDDVAALIRKLLKKQLEEEAQLTESVRRAAQIRFDLATLNVRARLAYVNASAAISSYNYLRQVSFLNDAQFDVAVTDSVKFTTERVSRGDYYLTPCCRNPKGHIFFPGPEANMDQWRRANQGLQQYYATTGCR